MSNKKPGKLGARLAMFENPSQKKETKPKGKVSAKKHRMCAVWEDRFKTTQPELTDGPQKIMQSWKPTNDAIKSNTTITETPGKIQHNFDNEAETVAALQSGPKKVYKDWKAENNTIIKPFVATKTVNKLTQNLKIADKLNKIIDQQHNEGEIKLDAIQDKLDAIQDKLLAHNKFDEIFNENAYFVLSNDNKTATFAKIGLPGAHDYQYYPACRLSHPIDASDEKSQVVTFKLFQYGWFGIGSDTVTPHGFPGYTNSGFMIRISDGGSHYNDIANAIGHHAMGNLTNQMVTMKYTPNSKELTVITENGQEYIYTHKDMPSSKHAYFVFTMAGGKVDIFDADKAIERQENKRNVLANINPARFSFDVYESNRFTITENGTIATGSGSGCCYSVVTTTAAFNQGVHSWKIKFTEVEHAHTNPGVITNINNLSSIQRSWVSLKNNKGSSSCGLLYMWHDYDGKFQGWNNGILQIEQGNLSHIVVNDVVTVVLDCNNWTITFYRNDQVMGTLNIPPNQSYHPCLYTCDCHRQKYQLMG